jgi:hypothetical protein
MGRCVFAVTVSIAALSSLAEAGEKAASAIPFNRDIRPILAEHCFKCHGPIRQQSGLRLDRRDTIQMEAESGAIAVVPGKSDESELIYRVSATDSKRMPPAAAGKPLAPEQVAKLRAWIDQGAAWEDHWAYVAPRRPNLPKVNGADWIRSPIDAFILARLERESLRPSAAADRYSLIRRASLDLTGLPPSPQDVSDFVNDARPDAYERLVDRLLASPAFGERWARVWLDIARYADTQGYEKDNRRTIWRYRDWVIAALNRNLPFDQFTIEQLAGDLLPNPTVEQLIATAFHRNTMTNTEGGTDDEEFRVAAVIDRIDSTMQTWMATTIGCVQCHHHPYDGIDHDEFYRVFAFFNNTEDNDQPDESPTIPTPTEEELARNRVLQSELAQLRAAFERQTIELAISQHQWERSPTKPPKDIAQPIAAILATPPSHRSNDQRAQLARHYRTIAPELKSLREKISQVERSAAEVTTTPILRELPPEKRRDTYVFVRGSFLSKGEKVAAGVPKLFPPLSNGAPLNRLTFARWLVDAANPLTGRVMVNRLWEQLFGVGLVSTTEDFGTQGQPPSHPELLDWLACRFVDDGWDIKEMLRLVVVSEAYRQSSRATPELLQRDPENRLLARGPRFRLEAETIRDQALAIAGLLSHKMYGPSVMPPQPDGVWQIVYSGDQWATSPGPDRYRRGIYTFWRRTSPYPSMVAFDAPSREFCVLRRVRTNTPLQSFVTLNDPVFVEAAQMLARRIVTESSGGIKERAAYGFRVCLGRTPTIAEQNQLVALYRTEHDHFLKDAAAAGAMVQGVAPAAGITPAELAAWTVVANVLLNLDELLTKG